MQFQYYWSLMDLVSIIIIIRQSFIYSRNYTSLNVVDVQTIDIFIDIAIALAGNMSNLYTLLFSIAILYYSYDMPSLK